MRSRYLLPLLMAFLLTLTVGPARAADLTYDYTDVGTHWAQESIAECRVNDFMTGYPGNTFGPEMTLSRAEALVSINRGLGWGKEAESTPTSGVRFPPDVADVFKGHIVVAANKQLISKDAIPGIRFNSPAPRSEVAAWIARALKLKGQGSTLSFTDIGGMTAENRDLLSGVVQAGIMSGDPEHTFRPNGSLTRAEMASILARMLDSGKISPSAGRHITGKLSQVDAEKKKLSVQSSGKTETFNLSGRYVLFRNGKKSSLDSFKVGENVRLSLDSTGKCLFAAAYGDIVTNIDLTGSPDSSYVPQGKTGYVVNKYVDYFTVRLRDNTVREVSVPGLTFLKGVTLGNYGSIRQGSYVELIEEGSQVKTVRELYGARKLFGFVETITSQTIHIEDDDDKPLSPDIAGGCRFRDSDGDRVDLEDIETGMYVELTLDDSNEVAEIKISGESQGLEGEVTDIRTSGTEKITIEKDNGREVTYYLDDDVVVREDSYSRSLSYVDEGMEVRLVLNGDNKVSRIIITDSSDSSGATGGEVTYIRTSGTERITIEDDDGDDHTYYIDDDVTVKEDGTTRSLSYVKKGMYVDLTLGSSDRVTRIEIEDSDSSDEVEGEVTSIRPSGTERITIEDNDGDTHSYYIDDDVIIREDGSSRDLSDIDQGMYVVLTLDNDDRVTRIEIEDSDSSDEVEGEVTDIRPSGTERITIEEDDEDRNSYYIDDDVIIREDGVSRSLSYIDEGMYVVLTLDNDDRVTRIEIEDSDYSDEVEGEVTDIRPSGTERITIEDNDGDRESYYIDNDVIIREDGHSRDLYDVEEGMYVELTLDDDDDVTRIEIKDSNSSSDLVKGEVTSIRKSGTKKIEVDEDGGPEEAYYISDNVVVKEGVINKNIYYIEDGMQVELTLDRDDRVVRIDIIR